MKIKKSWVRKNEIFTTQSKFDALFGGGLLGHSLDVLIKRGGENLACEWWKHGVIAEE